MIGPIFGNMSKTQLKKELAQLDAEQMRELIIDLYDARKEAKDYLDFFVNPDIEARLEKARTAISKEMRRVSHGRCIMRISRVKQAIKSISSLKPGDEHVCEIMTYSIVTACEVTTGLWVKEPLQEAIAKLLRETVILADSTGMLDCYVSRLKHAIKEMKSGVFSRNHFKTRLADTLRECLNLTRINH